MLGAGGLVWFDPPAFSLLERNIIVFDIRRRIDVEEQLAFVIGRRLLRACWLL
jgi:hypothetical protein